MSDRYDQSERGRLIRSSDWATATVSTAEVEPRDAHAAFLGPDSQAAAVLVKAQNLSVPRLVTADRPYIGRLAGPITILPDPSLQRLPNAFTPPTGTVAADWAIVATATLYLLPVVGMPGLLSTTRDANRKTGTGTFSAADTHNFGITPALHRRRVDWFVRPDDSWPDVQNMGIRLWKVSPLDGALESELLTPVAVNGGFVHFAYDAEVHGAGWDYVGLYLEIAAPSAPYIVYWVSIAED